jgi:hypothetical protein
MIAPDTLPPGLQRAWLGQFPIFNIILFKQHLHERRLGIPVRGYNSSCGKSNIPAPLTG